MLGSRNASPPPPPPPYPPSPRAAPTTANPSIEARKFNSSLQSTPSKTDLLNAIARLKKPHQQLPLHSLPAPILSIRDAMFKELREKVALKKQSVDGIAPRSGLGYGQTNDGERILWDTKCKNIPIAAQSFASQSEKFSPARASICPARKRQSPNRSPKSPVSINQFEALKSELNRVKRKFEEFEKCLEDSEALELPLRKRQLTIPIQKHNASTGFNAFRAVTLISPLVGFAVGYLMAVGLGT